MSEMARRDRECLGGESFLSKWSEKTSHGDYLHCRCYDSLCSELAIGYSLLTTNN